MLTELEKVELAARRAQAALPAFPSAQELLLAFANELRKISAEDRKRTK